MLKLEIFENELFDEQRQEFVDGTRYVLELEHSLLSVSKWESIFEKPFLGKEEKTIDEVLTYIRCMVLTVDFPENIINMIGDEHLSKINSYVEAKHTATWFSEFSRPSKTNEIITSELIYYWMFSLSIPIECENWNLNRLLTLIKIFQIKNQPPKKISRSELAARNRQLNEQRRAQLGTTG